MYEELNLNRHSLNYILMPEFQTVINPFVKLGLKFPDCRVYVQGEWLILYGADVACRAEPRDWIYQVMLSGRFRISSEPVPGSIACWGSDDADNMGLVAIVEAVDPEVSFTIRYWTAEGPQVKTFYKDDDYMWEESPLYLQGFIHPPM